MSFNYSASTFFILRTASKFFKHDDGPMLIDDDLRKSFQAESGKPHEAPSLDQEDDYLRDQLEKLGKHLNLLPADKEGYKIEVKGGRKDYNRDKKDTMFTFAIHKDGVPLPHGSDSGHFVIKTHGACSAESGVCHSNPYNYNYALSRQITRGTPEAIEGLKGWVAEHAPSMSRHFDLLGEASKPEVSPQSAARKNKFVPR